MDSAKPFGEDISEYHSQKSRRKLKFSDLPFPGRRGIQVSRYPCTFPGGSKCILLLNRLSFWGILSFFGSLRPNAPVAFSCGVCWAGGPLEQSQMRSCPCRGSLSCWRRVLWVCHQGCALFASVSWLGWKSRGQRFLVWTPSKAPLIANGGGLPFLWRGKWEIGGDQEV